MLTNMSTLNLPSKTITTEVHYKTYCVLLAFFMDKDHHSHVHQAAAPPGRPHAGAADAAGATCIEMTRTFPRRVQFNLFKTPLLP